MKDNSAYLSLGSNMGDRQECLRLAIQELEKNPDVKIAALSSIYETDPVGYTDQANFLNMAVKVSTTLSALQLLELCLRVEQDLGRIREFRWGPRIIDLDILLYNKENIEMETLQVPHPRMTERAFVLIPLLEIDRSLVLPKTYTPLVEVLDEIPDKEGVRLWKQINGEDASALFES
ncbi:2-amino-4-hydroxy-6-hydroxymethyldihydropteridine diphosphokinase [Lederbergia citrea]|uniref:2-amino-4-hydroxy-6-hydroxymethyldihydropteridine diphosphokinase n=1 Tax=Lederbergia citrea TaxID=2833581 RepID=A0A942UU22_9BACI|nr:2-amino-4-hydroxy-6-hydroxymethyldihydropteridine diphosphokinase [Lederbergia citrea]MBS4179708.1 2-amino-4-hydroxy-6-hydroxymethyldihydropteridine diphosphokinase [Lederbergia citrea]MBS4206443.1 2-amino-4-hydroxy-6-hydroxymethyldihydropteridine diphosphokinase [Lederbergia citrea]MBS4225063.1 2-amino-4-hydroxy-6-hydroxymethyldihydropteridine diphosphokinase [Lederbergia citrea]